MFGMNVIVKDGRWKPFNGAVSKLVSRRYAPNNWYSWEKFDDNEVLRFGNTMQMTSRAFHALKQHPKVMETDATKNLLGGTYGGFPI